MNSGRTAIWVGNVSIFVIRMVFAFPIHLKLLFLATAQSRLVETLAPCAAWQIKARDSSPVRWLYAV